MTTTLHEPAPPGPPAWLALGVLALDTENNRIGVAQLFRDDLGNVNTDRPILRATHVLLRPVGDGLPWWAHVADLQRPPGSGR
jgi:hypothetical protein